MQKSYKAITSYICLNFWMRQTVPSCIGNLNTDDKVWASMRHSVCYLSAYWQYKYGWQSVEHHEMTAINCGGRVVPSATLSPLLVPIARPLLILPLTRATSRHLQPCNIEYAREENYYLYWIWKQLSPIYLNLNQSYRRIYILKSWISKHFKISITIVL